MSRFENEICDHFMWGGEWPFSLLPKRKRVSKEGAVFKLVLSLKGSPDAASSSQSLTGMRSMYELERIHGDAISQAPRQLLVCLVWFVVYLKNYKLS